MKRMHLGFFVLIFLLAGGIAVSALFCHIHDPIASSLQAAAAAAQAGSWEEAIALADEARLRWDAWWHFTAAFADHGPMDEIDSLFAQLPVFIRLKSEDHFPSLCTQLAQLAEAMADSHRLRWWTLL